MLFNGLLFFIFLITIRPQDFMPGLRGTPVVFVVMAVLLTGWVLGPEKKEFFRTAQDKYYGLFFVMVVVSTLSVGWLGYSFEMAVETFKIALIYWFTVTLVKTEHQFRTVTWTLVLFMALVGAMGVLQFYGYDITGSGMVWAPDKELWQIRGAGLFDNPNDLAYSVMLVVPFALGGFARSGDILARGMFAGLLLLALYCIYLTQSRGGYLALVCCCVTWFYFWVSDRSLKRMVLVVGLVAVLAAFTVKTRDYRSDASSMGRVEAWTEGMEMLKSHPLIGVGKDQFREFHKRDSHSSYVRAGAELGFIGLFAFIGILYSGLRTLGEERVERLGPDWKLYRTAYLAYLSSFLVASLFSTRTYDILFMIVIALTGVTRRFILDRLEPEEEGSVREQLWNGRVVAYTILVLVLWKLFLRQV